MLHGVEKDLRKVTVEVMRRGSAWRMRSQSSVGKQGRPNAGVKEGGGLHEDDIDDKGVHL